MLNFAISAEPGKAGSQEELGEVFTREWVVEFILDLVGYRLDNFAVEPQMWGDLLHIRLLPGW